MGIRMPPIGEEHNNPILNTSVFKFKSTDGIVDQYTVNIIVDNLVDHVDDQGWDTGIFEYIVSFHCDPDMAIPTGEKAYIDSKGSQRPVITTKSWDVQVKYIDRITDW